MNPANSNRPAGTRPEPRFAIGQDVHLKTGGPVMIVNQYAEIPEGGFIVDTIWFGAGRAEEYGSYQEEELEARVRDRQLKR
jgi:uncharacterized protein YodC (DUF2158 family)